MCSRPAGVDEDHIAITVDATAVTASKTTDAGSGALWATNDRDADSFAPGRQLFGGSGPEGIGGTHHDVFVRSHQEARELARGGRLSSSVDTHKPSPQQVRLSPTFRAVANDLSRVGSTRPKQVVAQVLANRCRVRVALNLDLGAKFIHEFSGGPNA